MLTTICDINSAINLDNPGWVRAGRHEGVDVLKRGRHLLAHAKEQPHVSAQPGVLHRVGCVVRP